MTKPHLALCAHAYALLTTTSYSVAAAQRGGLVYGIYVPHNHGLNVDHYRCGICGLIEDRPVVWRQGDLSSARMEAVDGEDHGEVVTCGIDGR